MNGNRLYAWAVVVSTDESVQNAVYSGKALRKTKTCGSVVAVLSTSVSKSCITQLQDGFDLVVVKDTDAIVTKLKKDGITEENALLISAVNMTMFSKIVVVQPGTMVKTQMDSLFDTDKTVMTDKTGQWIATVVTPNRKHYGRIVKQLNQSFGLDVFKAIFPGQCKTLNDERLYTLRESVDSQMWKDAAMKSDESSDWTAIVGMACRFPNANTVQEYWNLLAGHENACSSAPEHRRSLVDVDPGVQANFLKCPIDQFDATFFGFSPSEATFTDPQARLLLEVSWEAFEDAAINPEKLKGTQTGVFYGSWLQEYRDAMNAEGSPANEDFIRKYIGNSFGCSAAKLSFFYGFTGPNVSTESGCSSSMVAVDLALKSLHKRECPAALVAGANILLHLNMKQKVLWAEDGKSKTFDASANGYARAEGVAVLILKRYSDAIRDGDTVHAIIRGSGVSQEGLSKSFGTPTVESECAAMKGALLSAKVDPNEVDYVEAHATGTAVGDPIEATAIVKAYAASPEEKARERPLYIGSGKTHIGHTESCSGMAGIFKVVLALQNELIPPHLNLTTMNPQVNFEAIPGMVPVQAIPWPKREDGKPRLAGVSSFGITGTDVHVIIQEAMSDIDSKHRGINEVLPTPPLHLLTFSAKSECALEEYTTKYTQFLDSSRDKIQDITYTGNVCRPHHIFRRATLGSSNKELRQNLMEGMFHSNKAGNPKVCFTFPGRIGPMDLEPARILYQTSSVFKTTMNRCDKLFQRTTGGKTMLPLLTNPDEDTMSKGVTWYSLILAVQYSLVKLWNSWGIHPDCVVGHCIGEISAAVVSGALPLKDVFKLVKCMDYFLQVGKDQPALMMAIQASAEKVEQLMSLFLDNNNQFTSSWLEIASRNAFDQTVIAGDVETMKKFKDFVGSQNLRCKLLVMDFCAHSKAVDAACEQSLPIFETISYEPMKIPYVCSVTGKVVQNEDLNGKYWYSVFRNAVNYTDACRTTSSKGLADVYIEMGLDGALSKITQDNLDVLQRFQVEKSVCLPSLHKMKGDKCWIGLMSSLAHLYTLGGNIDWDGLYGPQNDIRKRVQLPSYPFQRKSFWYERRTRNEATSHGESPPDVITFGGKKLHPLVGVKVETCVEDPSIFQNLICDTDSETEYIYDHIIGTHVIYPGAAYLETMLASVAAVESNIASLTVEGFTVTSPLHLPPNTRKVVQSVVDKKNRNGAVFALHHNGSWKLHAKSTFLVTKIDDSAQTAEKLDDFDAIKIRCIEKQANREEFYVTAAQVGLNFGKNFRSLTQIAQTENGSESLISVSLPKTDKNTQHLSQYICHPVLIDAMIQGFILHTKPQLKKLHVPVQIGRFTVITSKCRLDYQKLPAIYVYCKTDPETGTAHTVHLVNEEGDVMATMSNAELVTTTVESVLKAAGCAAAERNGSAVSDDFPGEPVNLDKFDIVWQRSKFHQMGTCVQPYFSSDEVLGQKIRTLSQYLESKNGFSKEEAQLDADMNKLCDLYVVKALYDLGWSPANGLHDLCKNPVEIWGVLPSLVPAFKHFVTYLKNGDLHPDLDYDKVLSSINCTLSSLKDYPALKTVQACGAQLAGILKGSLSPHKILFGGTASADSSVNLAEHFYTTSRFSKAELSLAEVYHMIHSQVAMGKRAASDTIRILEVGGGTAGFASGVVRLYKERESRVKFEYTFTDISSGFLGRAKEKFIGEPFVFKTFNIEMDPLKQGFAPSYYDIVVAMDVVHATKNVTESLQNLNLVTKPGGWILLAETERPVKEVDICFGIFDGYWQFEDGIRKDHCTLTGDQWIELLKTNNYTRGLAKFLSCNDNMSVITGQKESPRSEGEPQLYEKSVGKWIIFSDFTVKPTGSYIETFKTAMKYCNRNVELIALQNYENLNERMNRHLDEGLEGIIFWLDCSKTAVKGPPDSRTILEPIFEIGRQLVLKRGRLLPRFHLVTDGCQNTVAAGDGDPTVFYPGNPNVAQAWGFLRNFRIELPGVLSKTIDLESGLAPSIACELLMSEIWLDDKETEVAFRGGDRYIRRAVWRDEKTQTKVDVGLTDCGGKAFAIELPVSKVISDVKFTRMDIPQQLKSDEILVQVKSVSLNFKDVLAIMKPSADFEHLTSIGLDFSGVVTAVGCNADKFKVGQPVFGCGWDKGAMKSHVVTYQDSMMPLPDKLTHQEGSTLPAVWVTAWYCMTEVAKLSRGQTALIHAASGGVGLMAIQIAKLLGVNIIGTAGTERKRRFLRSLGVEHVFNSRNTDFGQQIQEVTKGLGVDMVLNCLTGPGFKEASLEVCKDGGHFVEISKLDVWSLQEVAERRARVNYTIVDATEIEKSLLVRIMDKLIDLLAIGSMKPLPYICFNANQVREALTFLQKAKQIGKVIITMPDLEEDNDRTIRVKGQLFNDRSSYLITGGMGAIGMSVAEWMVTKGAKYIILVGRSPPSEDVKANIRKLEKNCNAIVVCKQVDITNFHECTALFENGDNVPPIRGVQHCAGVLSDKLLSQHANWDEYARVLHPKVKGAWNLHQVTKSRPLEHFILYSSAASSFGNIGQSNYVAANCYLDCLSEMRVAMGLPSLTINWGQWNMGFARDLSVDWLHPFTAVEGLATLESLMRDKNPPCVLTGLFDFHGLLRMTPYFQDTFLSTMNLDETSFFGRDMTNKSLKEKSESAQKVVLIEQYQMLEAEADRRLLVKEFVVRVLCETLGTKPEEIVDEDQHFSEMGMDSLMSIEFANKINSEIEAGTGGGSYLDLEECGTLTKMTNVIYETLKKLV